MSAVSRTIDYSALTEPVTRDEVVAFKAQSRADGVSWGRANPGQIVLVVALVFIFGFVVLTFAGGLVSALISTAAGGVTPSSLVGIALPLVFVLGIVGFGIVALRRGLGNSTWETWLRLTRFAAANQMLFSASQPSPSYPGAIFNLGDSRKALNHLVSATDRFLDIGNYQYMTGSGKSRSTHNWGFMALNLDRKLPNMVLDSKANNGMFGTTNLPATFAKNQVLSLEGDFNEHFTLYCPKEYERDALYVFTPDLMALLIDEAAPFDVEIVDDWMFVYSSTPFRSLDPAVYARLFRIVDTVGAKALAQTDRYVDQRVGDFAANIVAPQGRRLKRGFSVATVVFVIVWAAFWLVPQVLDFFTK